jgi:hypothetical protein
MKGLKKQFYLVETVSPLVDQTFFVSIRITETILKLKNYRRVVQNECFLMNFVM